MSLTARIERHMSLVDQALDVIYRLNPTGIRRTDLPDNVREIVTRERNTIAEIVEAEVHFWSEALKRGPSGQLDPTELAWVQRIVRLARIVGPGEEGKENLELLRARVGPVA
jgi:hypothetical protein